ncbi:MAG: septum formation initiator family protein [Syntrophomonadaceae bacterium]|nr:septum formation initiator family protein [Syntrophomonadaceae bacterium]
MKSPGKLQAVLKLAVFSIIFVLIALTAVPKVKTIWELSDRRAKLEEQKAILEKENKKLKQELKSLDSRVAVEKLAREQLGMVKNGENYVMPLTTDNP